jgi:N-acetyl-anhydromuramyl-L-alanine amidase AmpD
MVQHAAYVRLVAALAEHYGIPLSNVQGHKEVAKPLGRKIDPTFDMTDFRRRVWVLGRRETITAKIRKAVAKKVRLSERIERWREKRASL